MIPKYAKFITSLGGLLIAYLQMYGATWHLVPVATAIGAALAVLGVPNTSKAAAPALIASRPAIRPAAQPPVSPPPDWPAGRAPGTQ